MEIYKEPQIYVVNNRSIAAKLAENYFVTEGDLGISKQTTYGQYDKSRICRLEHKNISNLHEYDVVIIDLQSESEKKDISFDDEPNSKGYAFKIEYPNRIFDSKPIVLEFIKSDINKNAIRIIFGDEFKKCDYTPVIFDKRGVPNEEKRYFCSEDTIISVGHEIKFGRKIKDVCENSGRLQELSNIIRKYCKGYESTYIMPKKYDGEKYVKDDNFIPLLLNAEGEVISYIGYSDTLGFELVLPLCDKKEELMEKLIVEILPDIFPNYFPESRQFNWLNGEEYQLSAIVELNNQIEQIRNDAKTEIEKIEKEKKIVEEEYKFIKEILIETGNDLVLAIKKYFEWLGFKKVLLIDKEGEKHREDLQIHYNEKVYIIEVKGLGGTSTDSDCSQVSKHRRLREKEFSNKAILPLYIVNHQRYTNPILREDPPFSDDQIDYAENDERGLLTTVQLYKWYNLIEKGVFSKKDVMESMDQIGYFTLVPKEYEFVGEISEYYSKKNAGILNLERNICVDDCVIIEKENNFYNAKVDSLQVDGKNVQEAEGKEVGIVLNINVSKGTKVYRKKQ